MKVIKLDGRFAGYPKWRYALQFKKVKNWGGWDHEFYRTRDIIDDMYGPDRITNPELETNIWAPSWLYSEHWYIDRKHHRILLKNEADITMIRLKTVDH